jgi:hypothetical protein
MDVSQPSAAERGASAEPAPVADPRLPTPDYGTLGPGSDIATSFNASTTAPRAGKAPRFSALLAIGAGITLAVVVLTIVDSQPAWSRFFPFASKSNPPTAQGPRQLDGLKAQKQAEALLEQAVAKSDGAVDQISLRVDHWQGKLKWNSQIATLTTAALNSSDMRVRESGIEVELAAYGLRKNSASIDYLLRTADSPDHAKKIWALWALGLMGNRGVQSDRVVQVLTAHLKDPDEDSRRWSVEGLALVGSTTAIAPLLSTMHDDPSPAVRERAACSLAECGMFTPEQRLSAVPQLLNYTDDPSLDAQTHGWAFLALSNITHQHLPNDSAAWRSWYKSTKAD